MYPTNVATTKKVRFAQSHSNAQFKALDRQVALLAVRLPSGAEGNVKVRRMARKLNKLMAPPEPEEEDEEWEEGEGGQREDELL